VELDGSGSYDADGTITQYSWRKISGPAEGTIVNDNAAKPNLVGLVEGVYEFELTVTDDKFQTATDVVKITIKSPDEEKVRVHMYPNPASHFIKVELRSKELKDITVAIYSARGQLMKTIRVGNPGSTWQQSIPLDMFPCGFYILKVTGENYNFSKIFIKASH
jgi:hypothetical protein